MSRLFALVIGIDQYQSSEFDNLVGCVKDAVTMRNALLQHSNDAQICLLTNADATRESIINSFRIHLIHNPDIVKNDPIVVYFAGNGTQLEAPAGRNLSLLIPHDFSPEVVGISDVTIHALLCELAGEKGTNITFVIDSCFTHSLPRDGKFNVRSLHAPIWPLHLIDTWDDGSSQYAGFFEGPPPPYVLLSACPQEASAFETSDGGLFTQELVATMLKHQLTYRELVLLINQNIASKGLRVIQAALCSGLYTDRLLFSIPAVLPIRKLRVFADPLVVDLNTKPDDRFVMVKNKKDASIFLRSGTNRSSAIIERQDGLAAKYGSRQVALPYADSDSIARALNGIAHFNHYLTLEPTRQTMLRSLIFWRNKRRPGIQLHHFKEDESGSIVGTVSRNLVRNGVASLKRVPDEHAFGVKIFNGFEREMYPYFLHFDPATYSVKLLYTPFPEDSNLQLPPSTLGPTSLLPLGFGDDGGQSFEVTVDEHRRGRAAEFLKVILCEKPVDLEYMQQDSPLEPASAFHSQLGPTAHAPGALPGIWDSTLLTITIPGSFRRGRTPSRSKRVRAILHASGKTLGRLVRRLVMLLA